jgi:hypothetical protein
MSVEDELIQEMVRAFQQLLQAVRVLRDLSRPQQERILREASSEFLKNDPRADAARQQLTGQTFEQLVAREVNRILDERLGPENAAEQNRDPQQVEAQQAAQGEDTGTRQAEAQGVEQQGSVFEPTGGQVVSPAVIGGMPLHRPRSRTLRSTPSS